MRIKYIGPFRAVEVPTLGFVAERDKPIEVPDADAERLLEQRTNWAAEKPPAPPKPEKSAAKPQSKEEAD